MHACAQDTLYTIQYSVCSVSTVFNQTGVKNKG